MRRKKEKRYRIAIAILSLVIVVQGLIIFYQRPKVAPPERIPPLPEVTKGKIAIVIDDLGYSLNNLDIFKQIKPPITVAVLPNLEYSASVAKNMHRLGFEVILHLPLEPLGGQGLEKNTILTSMDEGTIRDNVRRALKSVPYCCGISNHMGSKATQDSRVMGVVLQEAAKFNFFFLDSYVSADSVCQELARKSGVRFNKRDIFLDNKNDPVDIRRQMQQLKKKANRAGQAIGIGHDRRNTLSVLIEEIPKIKEEGYEFVFVSELVE